VKLSRFFEDLMAVYNAEIEDLKSDSEGKNVLKARLREKGEQLPLLLPMMDSNPEMLASAFHLGFIFLNPLALEITVNPRRSQTANVEKFIRCRQARTMGRAAEQDCVARSGR
jgi:hypothetical protein